MLAYEAMYVIRERSKDSCNTFFGTVDDKDWLKDSGGVYVGALIECTMQDIVDQVTLGCFSR